MIKPHIIILGNEKGGTGKSTLAMHIIVYLLKEGKNVASIDLDGRQGSLTKYIKNRENYAQKSGINLSLPAHITMTANNYLDKKKVEEDIKLLDENIKKLSEFADFIVIDTPGSDNYLMRAGHNYANTLITPINDSLIDLDVLGTVSPETNKIVSPSQYSQTVWETRQFRASRKLPPLNWFVIRNRLSYIDSHNHQLIDNVMTELAKRIMFTPIPGLGERVIYRELFLKGLTMLDLKNKGIGVKMGISHIAARHEIKVLIDTIREKQEKQLL